MYKKNTVTNYGGFFVSVAYNCTYDDNNNLINETALVFLDKEGKRRFWILKHDVSNLYKKCKTLTEAKKIYRKEHKKGNGAFWTDYDKSKDR